MIAQGCDDPAQMPLATLLALRHPDDTRTWSVSPEKIRIQMITLAAGSRLSPMKGNYEKETT
jgi:hypothetical protein